MKKAVFLVYLGLFSFTTMAQEKKTAIATRVETAPVLDGKLNDACWDNATPASDFIQYGPYNGSLPSQKTFARFVYDDIALYVGIMLYDDHPDSIFKELGKRDGLETLNADLVSVDLLPYNDGLNAYEFKMSASGVVSDTKYSPLGQYPAWDAIWECKVSIVDSGWIAEVRIPFAALRFPDAPEQIWGMNMWRSVKRNGQWSTWNFVNKSQNNVFADYGILRGIRDIKQGVRLSVYPYISGYTEKFPGNDKIDYTANGGMDLKYGLSESFTLDATMIPDFGQVQSDDKVLNLTPFEIKYNEKRQFFVEGTEMFSKCGLFYSRRIGATPNDYYNAYNRSDTNEYVVSNPETTRMINATKVSGRTKSGLGIGIFNAMTSNTHAVIGNSINDNTYKELTQPFTNYSLIVLDQNLPNNSYISLVNTNLNIPNNNYIANVTGTEFKIGNKKNNYTIGGTANLSQHYVQNISDLYGLLYKLSLNKVSGAFQFQVSRYTADEKYNPNDLGYLQNNNETNNSLTLSHSLLKPKYIFHGWNNSLTINHSEQYTNHNFVSLTGDFTSYANFKNFMAGRISISASPSEMIDYYEARYPGVKFVRSGYLYWGAGYATDSKKKVTFESSVSYMTTNDKVQTQYEIEVSPRIRISDKFQVSYYLGYIFSNDEYGYLDSYYIEPTFFPPVILFCKRDLTTITNLLSCQYTFNPRSSLSLRCRHYWSKAIMSEVATLNSEGKLENFVPYTGDNINYNVFNTDLQYIWNFAPGSELSIVWKNFISNADNYAEPNFYKNFSNMLKEPQGNSLSVKLLYYLDYNYIFKH
ncbi:MAG: hypothetical protein CVU05_01380 [Bacteroidetes bacterium HGW-Bacteroidetes-21]|nr:MAG: hypothetical protein CVU05_01380 [Bacteroidetes bacterium HGW-Bacteroidetes-21]